MNFDFVVFFFGCIGAAAPEIVRIYRTKSQSFDITRKNALVSVIFFVLGGTLAIAFQSPSPYAAFYTGVATPLIISKLGEQSPPPPKPVEIEETVPQKREMDFLKIRPSLTEKVPSKLSVREYLWMLNASR